MAALLRTSRNVADNREENPDKGPILIALDDKYEFSTFRIRSQGELHLKFA